MSGAPPPLPVVVENIPAELRRLDSWVCWRLEERGGKPTKPPVSAKTGKLAKVNDPTTWAPFSVALAAYQASQAGGGAIAGIGVVIPEGSGLVGLDFDKCRNPETGILEQWASDAIRMLDSYTENSPSGRGLRAFVAGSKAIEICRHGRIEAYDRPGSRYLTVTGHSLKEFPRAPQPRQKELDAFLAAAFVEKSILPEDIAKKGSKANGDANAQPKTSTRGGGNLAGSRVSAAAPSRLSDDELLAKARAANDGGAFERLWSGDTSGQGGDSSASDLALCNKLAFWTGRDGAQMDRLFRQSGLMRPKWEERHGAGTYGERTIQKAIEGCREVFGGNSFFSNSVQDRINSVHDSVQREKNNKNDSKTTMDTQSTGERERESFNSVQTVQSFASPNFDFLLGPDASTLPSFPVGTFPSWIRNHVLAVAESTQTPVDLAACMALGALSVAMARKRQIHVGGQREPINVYLACVMGSGNIKSGTMAAMFAPIQQAQRDLEDGHKEVVKAARVKKYEIQGKIDRIKAGKKKGAVESEDSFRLPALQAELDELVLPPIPALFVRDVTPEALTTALHENDGRMGCVSDEGAIFSILGGAYSGRSPVNIQVFLDGWSETDTITKRQGRDIRVRRPALTMAFAVQPSALRDLAKVPDAEDKGLLARFLFSTPPSFVGHRNVRAPAVPEAIEAQYAKHLRSLVDLPNTGDIEALYLSPDAEELFLSWREKLEASLQPGRGALGDLRTMGAKLHGQCLRIAGLLHMANYADFEGSGPKEIEARTIQDAITVTRYFAEHGRAAYSLISSVDRSSDSGATYLFEKGIVPLAQRGELEIPFRDLHRGVRKRFQKVEALRPVVSSLVAFGVLRVDHRRKSGSIAGKTKEVVVFRPDLLECWAEWQADQDPQDPKPQNLGQFGQNWKKEPETPYPSASEHVSDSWTELNQSQDRKGQKEAKDVHHVHHEEATKPDGIENVEAQESVEDSVQGEFGQNQGEFGQKDSGSILSSAPPPPPPSVDPAPSEDASFMLGLEVPEHDPDLEQGTEEGWQ